jgi:hypothetical protein
MDQGVAAALVGVAGLVGAAIGGLATAYGARIGAQKCIEAVGLQVQQQSAAEHAHWVREQRRQAATAFIDGFVAFAAAYARCSTSICAHAELTDDQARELSQTGNDLTIARGHLELWGPESVVRAADVLNATVDVARNWINEWDEVYQSGDSEEINTHASRATELANTLGQVRKGFVRAAREALSTPD